MDTFATQIITAGAVSKLISDITNTIRENLTPALLVLGLIVGFSIVASIIDLYLSNRLFERRNKRWLTPR